MPRVLLAILVAGLLIRLGLSLARDASDRGALASLPDQREYLTLGRNLLFGRGLVMRDDRLDVNVYAFRAPGYPMFVAMCGGSIRAIRIAQALLDTSTILAAYLLARKFLPVAACGVAICFVAFNPYLVYFSSLILSETLFIAMLAWGMYFLINGRRWWIGSLLLAASLLVRPGAMLLPIVLALASAGSKRDLLIRPILTAVMTVAMLFPWAYRNHRVIDHWVWTTTNGGVTLYDGFNPGATGGSDQGFVFDRMDELRAIANEKDRSDYLAKCATDYIRQNPLRAIKLTIKKIARIWSPVPLSADASRSTLVVLVSAIYSVPLFALTAAGLFLRKLSAQAKVYLLVPAIYLTVIHALSVGSLRYRLPADVSMAVVAASVVARQARKFTADELLNATRAHQPRPPV